MSKNKGPLFPKQALILEALGENIRLARLRRNLSSAQLAKRAGIGVSTYLRLEKGNPGVSIGHLIKTLMVLGLDGELGNIAKDDQLGRKLQDIGLSVKNRASKKTDQ